MSGLLETVATIILEPLAEWLFQTGRIPFQALDRICFKRDTKELTPLGIVFTVLGILALGAGIISLSFLFQASHG